MRNSNSGMRISLAALLCFVLSLAMHLPWLAITPIAGTEGHRILPAHSMVTTHQWIAPMLFGQPFLTKPPLHHWLIAGSEILSGGGPSFEEGGPKALFFWRLPSAITGAALCAALAWFGGRWFGRRAGLISGMCCVGMIAIWGQSQVADIDATNTLFSALAALCFVELLIVQQETNWFWIIAATLSTTGMMMTKGPAGLPIVLGVWICGVIVALLDKRWIGLAAPGLWIPWIVAGAAIGDWVLVTRHLGHGGVNEGTKRLFAHSLSGLFDSVFKMFPLVIAFALPTVVALPLFFRRDISDAMDDRDWRLSLALVSSTCISWLICILSGMVNPRYAYPTLVLLCPLAGAICIASIRNRRSEELLRTAAFAVTAILACATIVLAVAAWKAPNLRLLLGVAMIGAVLVALRTLPWLARSWNGAWGLVALLLLTSISFGVQRHWSRTTRDSKFADAQTIRDIVGDKPLAVGGAMTSHPEAFFYAQVKINFIRERDFNAPTVAPNQWIVLDQAEHKVWIRQGAHLERDRRVWTWGNTDYYMAWFTGYGKSKTSPAMTFPGTAGS